MEGATLDGHPLTRQLQVIYHQNRTPDRTHVPGCNVLQLQSKCRPEIGACTCSRGLPGPGPPRLELGNHPQNWALCRSVNNIKSQ